MMASGGIDLECGGTSTSDDNHSFSDVEDGSCFYSTYGDDLELSPTPSSVDATGDDTKIVTLHLVDRDCRICHLSLVGDGDDAIELGCCCKDDLAAAHKHCAETWFKIRGNKSCEICNSIVSNLVIPNETSVTIADVNLEETNVGGRSTARGGHGGGRGCINGHRLLNFILACLVFAFVISWLFHFNIPS